MPAYLLTHAPMDHFYIQIFEPQNLSTDELSLYRHDFPLHQYIINQVTAILNATTLVKKPGWKHEIGHSIVIHRKETIHKEVVMKARGCWHEKESKGITDEKSYFSFSELALGVQGHRRLFEPMTKKVSIPLQKGKKKKNHEKLMNSEPPLVRLRRSLHWQEVKNQPEILEESNGVATFITIQFASRLNRKHSPC